MPESGEGGVLKSINPSNGEVVGEVPVTPPEAIESIVREARAAAVPWRALSLEARRATLAPVAKRLEEDAETLGTLLSREMGKPKARGIGEVRSCAQSLPLKLERAAKALGPEVTRQGATETTIVHDPLGVCAVIAPWNYPMSMVQWMVVPALMAGNAVVLKPSEETPLIAQAYVDRLNEVLPPGVVRIVHGADAQGKALVQSSVDFVAFTGSREVGIHIMRAASDSLKRLVLELGGKDPLLVLDGADVEAAARFAVDNSYANGGQMCVATERVFVHAHVADAFEERVVALAQTHRAGAWDAPDVTMGPMIHERQRAAVLDQMREAVARGARLLHGTLEPPARYVLPSVLADVTDDMRIAKDETFGPVVALTRFTDLDAAVESANASPYGLGAVVFGPPAEAERVARRLDAGMIGINQSIFGVGDTPWVGAKQSGYGFHGSPAGTQQFAQTRVVSRRVEA